LDALVDTAYGSLTPQMTSVHQVLTDSSRSGDFVHQEAGKNLFDASMVLHFEPTGVAQLVVDDGIEAVAEAFRAKFARPIIESQQVAEFTDPSATGSWGAFCEWAQALWHTIEQQSVYDTDIDRLVGDVFDHDKGYNRAINFAQAPTLAALMDAPPLAGSFEGRADVADPSACGLWLYMGMSKAGLISSDGSVAWTDFVTAAESEWAVVATALGDGTLTPADVLTDQMKDALDAMSLVAS
jgi:hypothetical protein